MGWRPGTWAIQSWELPIGCLFIYFWIDGKAFYNPHAVNLNPMGMGDFNQGALLGKGGHALSVGRTIKP